jgi:hypothetical protein
MAYLQDLLEQKAVLAYKYATSHEFDEGRAGRHPDWAIRNIRKAIGLDS